MRHSRLGDWSARRKLCKLRKGRCVFRVPSRQRWTVLHQVCCSPQDAALIQRAGDIVIRTQDVEVSRVQAFQHEVNGLFRGPCSGRLFRTPLCGELGEYKPRNKQMRSDLTAGCIAQLMLQRLSKPARVKLVVA